jgi:hypothetical protein
MGKWPQEVPGLEAKLEEHCLNREKVSDLLVQKSIERRVHRRVKIEGRVDVQILNAAKKPVGKQFRGQAADISVEGFSFFFKTPKKETARLLLGRSLQISYTFEYGGKERTLERNGRAIGVSYHLFNDFAIHMKFYHRVEVRTIDAIEKTISPDPQE